MTELSAGDFVWLDGSGIEQHQTVLRHVVGMVRDSCSIDRWCEMTHEGELRISRHIDCPLAPWLPPYDTHIVRIIRTSHPDYDHWWAWFTAIQLGTLMPLPAEYKGERYEHH